MCVTHLQFRAREGEYVLVVRYDNCCNTNIIHLLGAAEENFYFVFIFGPKGRYSEDAHNVFAVDFFDLNKFALSLSNRTKKVKPFYTIWMRQDGSCALFILCLCVDIDKGHLHAYPAYGCWRFLHKGNQALLVEGPCYSQGFFL